MKHELADYYSILERNHWWFRARRCILIETARKFLLPANGKEKPRILDLGCGPGANLDFFSSLGDLVGIDASLPAVKSSAETYKVKAVRADACQVPFGNKSFDSILCLDVLEHMEDDIAVLGECHRVLISNGVVMLTVPAVKALFSRHDDANSHKRRYERASLLRACRDTGFEVLYCSYFNTLLFLPAIAVRLLLPGRGIGGSDFSIPGPLKDRILEKLMGLERHIISHCSLPFGMSILAVIRKLT